jgi:hypothetical protein
MTDVACFAARTCGVPEVTMTSTLSRTNSAAFAGLAASEIGPLADLIRTLHKGEGLAAWCDDFDKKPVEMSRLLEKIKALKPHWTPWTASIGRDLFAALRAAPFVAVLFSLIMGLPTFRVQERG